MIKLYGVRGSRAGRSLAMLDELGVAYENVPVHWADEAKRPEFLAINPNGKIPALDDNGTVLFESLAINLYLAEKYGRGTLWPESVEDHGRCYQWSIWAMTEMEPLSVDLVRNRSSLPENERDEAKAEACEEALRKPLGVLNGALAGRDYLLGPAFTVADLNVWTLVFAVRVLGRMDVAGFPNVRAWFKRCRKRSAFADGS
jgi:glutathione S-transferase